MYVPFFQKCINLKDFFYKIKILLIKLAFWAQTGDK